jgi:hypothetical protein
MGTVSSQFQTLILLSSFMRYNFFCFLTLAFFTVFLTITLQMAAELNLEGLTLSDEGLTLDIDPAATDVQIMEHCLIGRLLSDKQIKIAYFRERMGYIWRPVKKVSIIQADDDRFLFQFRHRLDATKVLDEGPWLYDNYNLVVERIAPGTVSATVNLNFLDIWVQVHNLSFGLIQSRTGHGIGHFLGELKVYDDRNTLHSSYMRLKVRINVTEPLKKEWQVRVRDGSYVTCYFKYEKLGDFCYLCGILGHTDKSCPRLFEMEQDDGHREWGEWLRPTVRRVGTAATNRYLNDPIPTRQRPFPVNVNPEASQQHASGSATVTPQMNNYVGRISAVQQEIHAIKSGLATAQMQFLAKTGKNNATSSTLQLPSSSTHLLLENAQHRPLVLGLEAAPPSKGNAGSSNDNSDDTGSDVGLELKKRKRFKDAQQITGIQSSHEDVSSVGRVAGSNDVGSSMYVGGDVEMSVIDNPLFADPNVKASPEDQACLGE